MRPVLVLALPRKFILQELEVGSVLDEELLSHRFHVEGFVVAVLDRHRRETEQVAAKHIAEALDEQEHTVTETGFIKTRHLDDKAGVACLLGALKVLAESGARPRLTTHFLFSTSEEVGFGASAGIPPETRELIAVDMGAVGKGQESDEYSVCICAKDSTGPFDYALRQRLVKLCRAQKIPYKVDIYPFYGSDAAVAVRAGLDAVTGLIGPGINASHNLERTHRKALAATVRLVLAYVEGEK